MILFLIYIGWYSVTRLWLWHSAKGDYEKVGALVLSLPVWGDLMLVALLMATVLDWINPPSPPEQHEPTVFKVGEVGEGGRLRSQKPEPYHPISR